MTPTPSDKQRLPYARTEKGNTVAQKAVRIYLKAKKQVETVEYLTAHNAPACVIESFSRALHPEFVPVMSGPQQRLLREWMDREVTTSTSDGQYWVFHTSAGKIAFNPQGRWGPHWKLG